MTQEDEGMLRDIFAGLALCGILSCDYSVDEDPAVLAYKYADEMMEARKPKEEIGIKTVRKGRRYDKTA
jgi:hypothetical protein